MPRATGGPSRRKPGAQAGKTGASGVERSSCSSLGRARHSGLLHGNACRRPAPVGQALIDLFSSLLAILMRRGLAFSATGMESRRTPLFTPDRGRPGNHHLRPVQLRHGPIHQNVSGASGLSVPAAAIPRPVPGRSPAVGRCVVESVRISRQAGSRYLRWAPRCRHQWAASWSIGMRCTARLRLGCRPS